MKPVSDEALMAAYKKGDPAAFEILLTRHEKGVYHFALRLLGDTGQAEDVTQESFLRVIKSASRYRATAGFRNYLYQITRNLCLDILRKRVKGRNGTGAGLNPESLIATLPDENPGPEHQSGNHQMRAALYQAIRNLPPEQREVFLLREVKDMKLQDVAAVTGTNLNTVKSRLRYALTSLREQLAVHWGEKEAGYGK